MIVDIRFRRNSSVEWIALNPILDPGEPGFETDTGLFKLGNGHSRWTELDTYLTKEKILELLESTGGSGSDPRVGNLLDLSTEDKANLVAAINEVNTPSESFVALYENAKAG